MLDGSIGISECAETLNESTGISECTEMLDESIQAIVSGTSQVRTHFSVYGIVRSTGKFAGGGRSQQETSDDALLPISEIVPLYTKAKTRPQFAELLVEKLIDEETRVKSNVRGRGKEMLDPTVIQYAIPRLLFIFYIRWVKKTCFQYHTTKGNMKDEWEKCIQSIDGKNRAIKWKQSYKARSQKSLIQLIELCIITYFYDQIYMVVSTIDDINLF